MLYTIYTDGSCLKNPGGPGGYAAVIFLEDEMIQELSGGEGITTSNRMEITAAIVGLRAVQEPSVITLYSDSQYVIKTLTQGWKRMKNLDLWTHLEQGKMRIGTQPPIGHQDIPCLQARMERLHPGEIVGQEGRDHQLQEHTGASMEEPQEPGDGKAAPRPLLRWLAERVL